MYNIPLIFSVASGNPENLIWIFPSILLLSIELQQIHA